MSRIRYALLAMCLVGCENQPDDRMYRNCDPNTPGRADFIIKCAEAANPKSDEEGEDLVSQCEKTSEELFCPYVMHHWDGAGWKPLPLPKEP